MLNNNNNGVPKFNLDSNWSSFNQDMYSTGGIVPSVPWGYPYGDATAYVPSTQDVTVDEVTYKLDPLSDTWGREVSNNKGKVKVQKLTDGFIITNLYKNINTDGAIRFVVIEFIAKGKTHAVLMPSDDFINDRFHKYIREIFRFPGCTKGQFDALVAFLLQTAPTKEIMLYSRQGFHELNNGMLTFASNPPQPYIPRNLISPSVQRRKLAQLCLSPQEIVGNWLDIFNRSNETRIMGLFHYGGLFQFLLRKLGLNIKQFLIVEPSAGVNEAQLKAMLVTNDIENYGVTTLDSGEEKIMRELGYVYDGIALFTDDSFVDEEKKMLSGLKSIIKTVRHERVNNECGNGLVVVVSKNAAYSATRLAPENVIVINTDGISLDESTDQIRAVVEEMDALVIRMILSSFIEIGNDFSNMISAYRSNVPASEQDESLETALMIYLVDQFFLKRFGFQLINDTNSRQLVELTNCKVDRCMNASQAIENEFATVISQMLREKGIVAKRKRKNMTFDDDGRTFMLDGNRMIFPFSVIYDALERMTSTKNIDSLTRALKYTKALEDKDGNARPTEFHNSDGKHQRMNMYDISAEILDADVLNRFHTIDKEEFFFSKEEMPGKEFLSILNDGNGNIAGRKICYEDEENGHFYVTGQSGWGKTYLLSQLIAKCFNLGHTVIIFDSSGSFSYEALCRNISKRFVDKNVTFHDIDNMGIPVDLFRLDANAGLPTRKKQLLGILQAAIGELSVPQSNVLRSIFSKVISNFSDESAFYSESIIEKLKEGGNDSETLTYESLLNRVYPLFEDIEECGMADMTWYEFFGNSKDIIVVHTASAYTESGNQLIDMLLATLYKYQLDDPKVHLDIFIDELQNQNFTTTSPIRKIMKEGRKSHMSFFGATQDYYPRSTELGSVMGKAGTEVFLRPTPNSENLAADELRFRKADMQRFDSMQRGDIFVKGIFFNREHGRNISTTLSGHVEDFPKIPENFIGTVY